MACKQHEGNLSPHTLKTKTINTNKSVVDSKYWISDMLKLKMDSHYYQNLMYNYLLLT